MTKYSIKNICLGIGIGLIIASVANLGAVPKSMSVEELKKEAQKHNLIVMDAKELIQKQPETKTPETAPVEKSPTAETSPEAQGEAKKQVQITIKSGATSESIAQLLLDGELIDNKQDFLARLKELKKESKVQIGTFNITKGSSVDQIIDSITSLPK